MTITVAILIAILVFFVLNLIVLIVYIGPILTEFRLIVTDVRRITDMAEKRVEKVDEMIENVTTALQVVKKITKVTDRMRGKRKVKVQDESNN